MRRMSEAITGGGMDKRKTKNGMSWDGTWYPSVRALYKSFENPSVTYAAFLRRIGKGWEPDKAATTPGTRGRKAKSE